MQTQAVRRDPTAEQLAARAKTAADQALRALLRTALEQHQAGRAAQAEPMYRAVLAVEPDHVEALHLLGVCLFEQRRPADAVPLIAKALGLAPTRPDIASNLGNALFQIGRQDEAEAFYRLSLHFRPNGPAAQNNLSVVLRQKGLTAEAEAAARTAVALKPDYVDAHNSLGTALVDLGRFDEAEACYREALRLDPQRTEALNNLGNVLGHLGRLEQALESLTRAQARDPDNPDIHHNRGMCLLALGRYAEGWAEYEHRWATPQLGPTRRDFAQPLWDGAPLAGRTLLVHAEQGFGDTLQFCRYAARVGGGGRVVLEVQPALLELARTLDGVDEVVAYGQPLPAFDVHCPMLSLPARLENAPDPAANAEPYLHAEPARAAAWAERLAALPGLKVGLVWAGGRRLSQPMLGPLNARRSMSLSQFAPLAEVEGVSFVSLQKDEPGLEAANPPEGLALHDFTAELTSFAETAALVANLDLVISVDTAVAHLAGAIGRPVWLLNRFDSCWRWGRVREDSVWYPTLRHFRQPAPGDWAGAVAALTDALGQRAAGRA